MSKHWERAAAAVLAQLAGQIAAAAPRGWKRAKLSGCAIGPASAEIYDFTFEPVDLALNGSEQLELFEGMCELHTLVEADDNLTIELTVESRGRYRAILSERLERSASWLREFRYVLDPKPERPPESGEPLAGPNAFEAGDPGVAVMRLGEFGHQLPAPLPEWQRRELTAGLGVTLPRDLLALYAAANGDDGHGFIHGYHWLGLESVAQIGDLAGLSSWNVNSWRRFADDSYLKDFGPPLTVRRARAHPAWIPFALNGSGDALAVDLAPGPRGRPGQVILVGVLDGEGPVYVADSVTELLRTRLPPSAEEVELRKDHYGETCTLEVSGPDAAPVRGIHPALRELTVSNAPWVDLEPVRGASAMWRFTAKNCPSADLSPLRDTPVEVLDLEMSGVELAGLAGHPTLRRAVLRTEKPVDLRPLLSCPQLSALDLSEAPEADVSVLDGLAGLRWLRLRRPQWEVSPIPQKLAVAELTEEPLEERKWYWSFDKFYKRARPTLRDAIAWASRLAAGGDAGIWTFRDRFRT